MNKSMGVSSVLRLAEKYMDVEPYSNRMKFFQVPFTEIKNSTIDDLKQLAKEKRCEKLIFYVKDHERKMFSENHHFYQEGIIAGFFRGTDAHIFAMFLNPKRNQPINKEVEQRIMGIVEQDKHRYEEGTLPKGYTMRHATLDDTSEMARLYDVIFETYPTPMNNAQFIAYAMQHNVYFTIVEYNNQIVSASAADFMPSLNAAEMTDCATLPGHRQNGLLSHQFSYLIERMKQKKVQTLFCYSRSVSLGMNLINARHGFTYGGRMVQNSNISGRLECMNIWFKNIRM